MARAPDAPPARLRLGGGGPIYAGMDEIKTTDTTPPAPPAPPKPELPPEVGGPSGPEPTRFGDWEQKGRCTDF